MASLVSSLQDYLLQYLKGNGTVMVLQGRDVIITQSKFGACINLDKIIYNISE